MKTGLSRLVAGAGVAALVAGIAVYSQSNVEAATATSSFTVSASVTANCTISAGALAFGPYDPVVTNASADLDVDQHDHGGLHQGLDGRGQPRQRPELQRRRAPDEDRHATSWRTRCTTTRVARRCGTPATRCPTRRPRRQPPGSRSTAAWPQARTFRSAATATPSSRRSRSSASRLVLAGSSCRVVCPARGPDLRRRWAEVVPSPDYRHSPQPTISEWACQPVLK